MDEEVGCAFYYRVCVSSVLSEACLAFFWTCIDMHLLPQGRRAPLTTCYCTHPLPCKALYALHSGLHGTMMRQKCFDVSKDWCWFLCCCFFSLGLFNRSHGGSWFCSVCRLIFPLLWPQNSLIKGVYPASPSSWLFVVIAILATMYMSSDPSMGLITKIQEHLPLRYTPHTRTELSPFWVFVDCRTGYWTLIHSLHRPKCSDPVECQKINKRLPVPKSDVKGSTVNLSAGVVQPFDWWGHSGL